MTRTAAILLIGTALAFGAVAPRGAAAAPDSAIVYGPTHVEAALTEALSSYVTAGRLRLEVDRAVELHAPARSGSLAVRNVYHNAVSGRFAAELVVEGTDPPVRMPVAGRAYGVVEVPVLTRRVANGDTITASDIGWVEVRADQAATDIAATEADLVGMTPKRGIPVNQAVRLRDVQTPRIVEKGAIVTITLASPTMTLTAQGRALQDGGRGDTIRVVNTQSNRIVEATVAAPNLVAVAKPGVPAY